MEVVAGVRSLREVLDRHRAARRSVGLVPTMGALHEGHLSLVRRAAEDCDTVVVSVFVNPLQFAPGEDYEAYPRDPERDRGLLESLGVDVVFAPDPAEFTPADRLTTVRVAELSERLEGEHRPGHFDGVTTIVTKLFAAAGPDRAYFGEKDYQQLVILRRMVEDLDLPVEIVAGPLVRDDDGLALSSRNVYLSDVERKQALALSRALEEAASGWHGDADAARRRLHDVLASAPGVRLDYAEICDPHSLAPLRGVVDGPARALVAAHVGSTRLIDNRALEFDSGRVFL